VRNRTLLLFFLAVGVFHFSALGTIPLLEPDEGRCAEVPSDLPCLEEVGGRAVPCAV